MSAEVTPTTHSKIERVNTSRIGLAGLVAISASVVANLVVLALLKAALPLPQDFPPLQPGAVIFFTTIYTFLATLVFYIIARKSSRPITTFIIVAIAAFILSMLPNLLLMANPSAAPFPGGTAQAFGVLVAFHIVAAVVCVLSLIRLTRVQG